MLKDKPITLLAILVVLLGIAFAASLVYCESSNTDCERLRKQSYARPEFALSPILLGDSKAASKQEQAAEPSPPPCPSACRVVFRTYDDPVALLTGLLVLILAVQLAWMVRQEKASRDGVSGADELDEPDGLAARLEPAAPAVPANAAATPNADAVVVGQMPVLSPHVTDTAKLHPLAIDEGAERINFKAAVFFTFENLGKTPAILREIRADLFLTDRETLPTVDFEKLQRHDQTFVIPGDARGSSGSKSVIEHQQAFSLRRAEFEELLSDATGAYRRFALIGKVTYDDLFGWRHSRTFCVKLRIWGQPPAIRSFQSHEGGLPYNRFRRERSPESERA